mmetsp:Transcript_48431/g.103764  ORF Transcript_48431/g.103764 Transcript_48431/m.103764 type:complete len:245 (-) Transcript_48431:1137-1871(-)
MMLRAQLEGHGNIVHAVVFLACHEAFHHLPHVRRDDACDDGGRADQALREFHLLHLLLENALDEGLEILLLRLRQRPLVLVCILLGSVEVQLEILIGGVHGYELLAFEVLDAVHNVLVDVLIHQQNIPAPLEELLHVGRGKRGVPVGASEIVDVLLAVLGGRDVILQGDHIALCLLRAFEPQELEEIVLVAAEVAFLVLDDARLQVVRIALEELGVLLRIPLGLLVQEAEHAPHHCHAELLHET